jgi:hypothetical protein
MVSAQSAAIVIARYISLLSPAAVHAVYTTISETRLVGMVVLMARLKRSKAGLGPLICVMQNLMRQGTWDDRDADPARHIFQRHKGVSPLLY